MFKKQFSWKKFLKIFLFLIVLIIGIWTIIATNGGGTKKPFILSYVDTSWKLRFRWSDDKITWNDPSGTPQNVDFVGGVDVDNAGMYMSIFKSSGSYPVQALRGLYTVWDSQSKTVGDGHRYEIASGTSIVFVQGQIWLVAYNHYNSAKVVTYDNTYPQDFKTEVTPVIGVINNNITDKPALVNRNGKLIVAWLMNDQLQMVTGDIQGGLPVWQPGYLFSANVVEQGYGSPIGSMALAHDGNIFYAAVVRQRDPLPDEQISHYFLFIYTSNDGIHWNALTSRESMNPESMSMAARGTNDIVIILTRRMEYGPINAYKFDGTVWAIIDNNAIFGSNPMNPGFDLTLFAWTNH
jgi:hypothetical protein